MSEFDDWPVAVPVNNDKVSIACIVKEVSTDALEWILGLHWGVGGGSIGLRRDYAVAMLASLT